MLVNNYEIKPFADLREANLQEANLQGTDLQWANLQGANLRGVNLQEANLQGTDLRWADLRRVNLRGDNLQGADLRWADLRRVNLQGTDLQWANLQGANLQEANLRWANLQGADLQGANLSQTRGLLIASVWLKDNFKSNKKGYIVFKAEGKTYYSSPNTWKNSKFIIETVNKNPTDNCGCGVNFATLAWIKQEFVNKIENGEIKVRRMYLHWEDLADVCVPYNTDGKARCGRLERGRLIKL